MYLKIFLYLYSDWRFLYSYTNEELPQSQKHKYTHQPTEGDMILSGDQYTVIVVPIEKMHILTKGRVNIYQTDIAYLLSSRRRDLVSAAQRQNAIDLKTYPLIVKFRGIFSMNCIWHFIHLHFAYLSILYINSLSKGTPCIPSEGKGSIFSMNIERRLILTKQNGNEEHPSDARYLLW